MSHREPRKLVDGTCPDCGKARIEIIAEGWTTFFMFSGPNESCACWTGRCCRCHAYLEAYVDEGVNVDRLEWNPADDDKIDFLLDRPRPSP